MPCWWPRPFHWISSGWIVAKPISKMKLFFPSFLWRDAAEALLLAASSNAEFWVQCSRYTHHLGESKAGLNTKLSTKCNTFNKENKFSVFPGVWLKPLIALVSWNSIDAWTTYLDVAVQLIRAVGWPWRMLRLHEGNGSFQLSTSFNHRSAVKMAVYQPVSEMILCSLDNYAAPASSR